MVQEPIVILANSDGPEGSVSLASARDVALVLSAPVLDLVATTWRAQLQSAGSGPLYFLATHGGFGEDGTLQFYLEERAMRHSHSPSAVSRLMTNKHETKLAYCELGIPTPAWNWLGRHFGEACEGRAWICKPLAGGSRQGLSMRTAPVLDNPGVISECFVAGDREISVWTLGADAVALPPLLRHRSAEPSTPLTPSNETVAPKLANLCTALAQMFHLSIAARGLIKTDFVIDDQGRAFAIETDAHPALSRDRGAATQAAKSGFTYEALIKQIVLDHV